MTRMPYVPWYTDDFLAGTLMMPAEEAGVYAKLMAMQHSQGGVLPLDIDLLMGAAVGSTREVLEKVLAAKFERGEDGYRNLRMSAECEKQQKKSAAGRSGGQAKRQAEAEAKPEAEPQAKPEAPEPEPTPTSLVSIDRKDWPLVRESALRIAKRLKLKLPDSWPLAWRVAYLLEQGYPEDWLHDSVEAVERAKKVANRAGYFTTCLRNYAEKRGLQYGRDVKQVPPAKPLAVVDEETRIWRERRRKQRVS